MSSKKLTQVFQKAPGWSSRLLEECSMDRGFERVTFLAWHGTHYAWLKPNTAFHSKNLIPTVKHGGGSVMVRGCFADWTTYLNRRNHEFRSVSENSTGECQAMRLWAEAEAQLGHAVRQRSKTHNQVYMKMAKKQHILSFGMAYSKSRPNPNWDVVAGLEMNSSCLKTHKCHWVQAVLHGRLGQNSSTDTWETDQQLQEAFGCSHCS